MNAITVTRSPYLQGCAGAFAKNLNRITMFSVALAEVGFNARIDQFFYDKATFNVTGRLDTTPEKLLFPETREMAEKIAADSARQNAKLSREQREALMVSYGIQYIEDYSVSSAHMGDAVKALFESVVLTSWTAFETLAGDLWAAGVDNGTSEMMARFLLYSHWEKPEDGINLESVMTAESDAKAHPGSFFREFGKVSFQKLHVAKTYFGVVFGQDCERLFENIAGGDIWLLSAFRNAITHCSGKADRQFVKRAQRFPEFRSIKNGDHLHLDGFLARRLLNAAGELGGALLKFVDDMLSPLPAPPSSAPPSSP